MVEESVTLANALIPFFPFRVNSFGGREKSLEEQAKAGLAGVKAETEKLADKGKEVVEKVTN